MKVSAQNAAVLITRQNTQLIFETFELSAANEAVQSARGRLVRNFPANATAIDSALLCKPEFTDMLSETLSTMSHQKVPEMQPRSKKSCGEPEEDRDTPQPAVVCAMLFIILRGIGEHYQSTSVRKNTREEVLWSDTRRPWPRSAMWLLLRVALQPTISRSPDGSHALYKNLMLLIMTRLLSSSQQNELPSELMHVMNAKINRRRQKLIDTDSLYDSNTARAEFVLRTSVSTIAKRWSLVQSRDSQITSMAALSGLEMSTEALTTLPELDKYVSSMEDRQDSQGVLLFQPVNGLFRHQSGEAPVLPSSRDDYSAQNLQFFEQWVSLKVNSWAADRDSAVVCQDLCYLIKKYHAVACEVYSENAEGLSVMLLTIIMELWVACDRAAVETCDLLKEFSAGMSPAVMQNLLLPFLDQMQRLSKVDAHLASRSQGLPSASIFSLDSPTGFPNRFYDTSQKHKYLHDLTRNKAETERQAKLWELSKSKAEYSRLNNLYLAAECEFTTKVVDQWCDPPEVETIHNYSCRKCAYRSERDALDIRVHEWPLPDETSKAKTVVFELAVPAWHVCWREARFYILHGVLKGFTVRYQPSTPYYLSSIDPYLSNKYSTTTSHRIKLLSETKPYIVTHYQAMKIPFSTESNVCVRNGLHYRYYDAGSESYLSSGFEFDKEMPLACTYRLTREAQVFEKFILRTESALDGQPPNAVLASQDACPARVTLEEYKELATVLLGHHVQCSKRLWSFHSASIRRDLLPATMIRYASPIIYCNATPIMSNLNSALQQVKENWESVNALSAFVAIAARVLSLNEALRDPCFVFLQAARCITADWLSDLREKAYLAMNNYADRTQFVSRSIEVALLCISTFDVDDRYLDTTIGSSDSELLIWASIVVQEGENNRVLREPHVARLQLRSKRLLHRSYAILSQNGVALDAAVKRAWSGYAPTKVGWSTETEHWLTTETATAAHIHYNLLSGELLVNGLPLDQPPADYRKLTLFQTLFGDATVEVMPAPNPGFQFSTKRSFGGCAIDLGMESGQLLVRATTELSTYETVPSSVLKGKYPHHFLNDYVLWCNTADKSVRFLPKKDP
ncbi:Uu.00g019620.m01.CDS01 [Anthostomella pinea]|uniref:Uu.00g019620.m01.CDS01 n=1 Tax=Anthostomella pinea TaxID=933095 RepID=A0AAI8W0I8_9PEZI|nr:Uu.00g019620.m01.CDS01 [Anthostomella pinea]